MDNTVGSLTSIQNEVLVGSLLGDGTLRRQGSRLNALFEANHSYEFKEYVDWKHEIFKNFVLTPPKQRQGNGNRIAYRFTTRSLPIFTSHYLWFYQNGKKHIPLDIKITPQILAVWFMDDGAKTRNALYLNTQQFSAEEQNILQNALKNDLGIISTLNRDKQYYRLYISKENSIRFRQIIKPYILSCFNYKLTNDPVTTDPKGDSLIQTKANMPTLRLISEMKI